MKLEPPLVIEWETWNADTCSRCFGSGIKPMLTEYPSIDPITAFEPPIEKKKKEKPKKCALCDGLGHVTTQSKHKILIRKPGKSDIKKSFIGRQAKKKPKTKNKKPKAI